MASEVVRSGVTFHVERVRDCWDEVYELAREHQSLTQSLRRSEPFNPDMDRFIQYNDAGLFHLLTCRYDGKLIGYLGLYITTSMHSQLRLATEDTFYLSPHYRKGRIALRFLRFMEEYLRGFAPIEALFSCEIDNQTGIHGLMKLLAYKPVITVYNKHFSLCADSAASHKEVAAHASA